MVNARQVQKLTRNDTIKHSLILTNPLPRQHTHRGRSTKPTNSARALPKTVRFQVPLTESTDDTIQALSLSAPTGSNDRVPQYGALDSGATDNFLPTTYVGTNPTTAHQPVKVGCANGTHMESKSVDSLNLPTLPPAARTCYKFDEVHMPLVSVPKLCDHGCQVLFNKDSVTVTGPNGQDVLLTGQRDPTNQLYMVPLHDSSPPRASTSPSHGQLPTSPTRHLRENTRNNTGIAQVSPPHTLQANKLHHRKLLNHGAVPPRVPIHQGCSAYEVQAVPSLIKYLHATAGFPPKATWLQAIEKGYFTTWPGLTPERVRKYLGKSEHTVKGHLHMTRQGARSTQMTRPPSRTHDVTPLVYDVRELPKDHENLLAWDLPGRYPVTSARGHKYLMILYNHDANYIHAIPMKSRRTEELIQTFQEGYDMFKRRGLRVRMVKMDNEVSGEMARYIERNNLDYQIVSPGDHRQNPAERAIQTFKNHFIAILSGTDPSFPPNAWDLLLTHAIVTLNLLRSSRIQPHLSAFAQVHGQFDFNRTPLGPAGCKVIVHERANQRGSWADHGIMGYYIGPALKHYRNYVCLIKDTEHRRVSNTVEFFPTCCPLPTTSSTDRLTMSIQDLHSTLKDPHAPRPYLTQGTTFNQAVRDLQAILNLTQPTDTALTPPNAGTPHAPRVNQKDRSHTIGTIVRKREGNHTYKEGEIIDYLPNDNLYIVHYTDNTQEELTGQEVSKHRKKTQTYNKRKSAGPKALSTYTNRKSHIQFIPTPKTHTSHPSYTTRSPHLACSGSIWDDDLQKMAAYRDLIKHPNPATRELWLRSGEDEFGRLFQGFEPNGIEGMDVLEWIHKDKVPAGKKVTYPRYTVAIRPEKADPYRTRITAGGDQLEYEGNVTTHTATMETIKTHWNSVASTPGAKYCTGDISNMYLCSVLDESEYVRFRYDLIPPRIVQAYNLTGKNHYGYVYARIKMAWYGLKQSGKIAHDDLVAHLAKYGYHKAKHTPGLFLHETRDISFTLVVDDFGIKYIDEDDVDHLIQAMREKYTFKVDWEGKQYIGIHLKWDYDRRQVTVSMDGYVEQALREFKHIATTRGCASPSKMERPDYGQKIQYVKEDQSAPLQDHDIKFIQQVTGKFLFYARAVDNTMLHAINDIARSKGTVATLEATKHFLNYAAAHPNGKIVYRASDMILVADSDAAYLVCPEARSRAGGYHYLTTKDKSKFNGPILVLAKTIKNVMASAAEAEVAALFMNAQEALPIRQCLIELGHPQPPTPLKTDNSTARGILTGTIKQKRSKAIDMRFYWLKDRAEQGQFEIYWEPGKNNLADYPTKHHSTAHHKLVRPIYLYEEGTSPTTVQGCIEILRSTCPKVRAKKYQRPLDNNTMKE